MATMLSAQKASIQETIVACRTASCIRPASAPGWDQSNPGWPAIIAGAFVATLWGVLSANVIWLPISNKLKRASQLETQRKRMILDGLLAIQAGSSPRLIQTRLQSYLSTADRDGGSQKSKEAA